MIISSQCTIYSLALALAERRKDQYVPMPNTTLNEKFGVLQTEVLKTGEYPGLKYMALGVGGSDSGQNTGYNFSPYAPTDAALFEHIPFVIRPITSDLTSEERKKYRLRVQVTVGGIEYVVYFLRVLDDAGANTTIYNITSGDIPTLTTFDTNTAEFLNPVPRDSRNKFIPGNTTSFVGLVSKIPFRLSTLDLAELENVMNILYGTTKNITEFALCTGVDRATAYGDEVVVCEASMLNEISIDVALELATGNDFLRSIEIGGSEPLGV